MDASRESVTDACCDSVTLIEDDVSLVRVADFDGSELTEKESLDETEDEDDRDFSSDADKERLAVCDVDQL